MTKRRKTGDSGLSEDLTPQLEDLPPEPTPVPVDSFQVLKVEVHETRPEESKEKSAPTKPRVDPNAVTLRVFLTACGKAHDKTAGFQNFANRMKLGPRNMREWYAEFESFQNRPIK